MPIDIIELFFNACTSMKILWKSYYYLKLWGEIDEVVATMYQHATTSLN